MPLKFVLLAGIVGAVLTPQAVLAQTAAASSAASGDSAESPEIIVTAQKRSQSINDVGLSITAATADQLTKIGVTDTNSLTRIVPGLTFAASLNNTPILTMRGVGFNDYTLGASPTVSVYTDQIAQPFPQMTQGAALDLERVEVLKGPQGILFGQNSTGGAINYIAAKPTNTFLASVNGSYGRFNEWSLGGFVNIPMSATLKSRFAVQTKQSGPWQYNTARSDSIGRQDFIQGRALLEWTPSNVTIITLNVNGWRDRSESPGTQLIGYRFQVPSRTSRVTDIQAQPLAPANARAANWGTNLNLQHDDNYIQVALRGDFEMTPNITLTSLTSYDHYKEDFGFDRDGTSLALIDVTTSAGKIDDFSQELRISGNHASLQWMVGANLFHAKVSSVNQIDIRNATNSFVGPVPFALVGQSFSQITEEYAAFTHVEYKILDTLTAIGGTRYTSSRREYTGCTSGDASLSAAFTGLSTQLSGSPTPTINPGQCVTLSSTFKPVLFRSTLDQDNVSWQAGLNFKPANGQLLYASVTKGYKSGGYPLLSASSASQLTPVSQESLTSYEAGFKLSLFNRVVQLNGAGFYYDYRDKQVRSTVVDPIFRNLERLVNVPKSRIVGFETDVTVRPFKGLTMNVAATFLDAKIKSFRGLDVFGTLRDFDGTTIPYTPQWQIAADTEYQFPVGAYEAYIGGHLTYNSSTNSTIGAPSTGVIRDFIVLDLRAGFGPADGQWSLSAYGRNVTNQYYWNNQFPNQDVVVRYAAKPVTYGLQASYRF